jgi:hypothetical protein
MLDKYIKNSVAIRDAFERMIKVINFLIFLSFNLLVSWYWRFPRIACCSRKNGGSNEQVNDKI